MFVLIKRLVPGPKRRRRRRLARDFSAISLTQDLYIHTYIYMYNERERVGVVVVGKWTTRKIRFVCRGGTERWRPGGNS